MTAAVAWSEIEAERGEGEGLWPRKAVASPEPDIVRGIAEEDDLEGGREFKSGAIAGSFYGLGIGWRGR